MVVLFGSLARGAQALLKPERSVPGWPWRDALIFGVRARRFQSAIRALGSKFQAHEIVCEEIDAHSA
jgi:hypothetical protein